MVNLPARIGSVGLDQPVMTASGTAGHGAELAPYFDLSELGAVVVKSMHPEAWAGNPPLRVTETPAGMLNSVGLQGPGITAWLADDLPPLLATGAKVIASIWGRSVGDYEKAATMLAGAPPEVVAVEVNLSCPNATGVRGGGQGRSGRNLFAHDPDATRTVMSATAGCERPRWAKLSPNAGDALVDVAAAAHGGGAEAVTLINTVMGMAIDSTTRKFRLGAGPRGGGLSGPAIHPVAVRAVFDVHQAMPELPIVGVGGVASGADAIELLLAGASAVQVGTATFADPRAPVRVLHEIHAWMNQHGVETLDDVIGAIDD